MFLKQYPKIEDHTNFYLIKTKNGLFYSDYMNKKRVGLYLINTTDELTNKKQRELMIFKDHLKEDDVIIIPGKKNKVVLIGRICSDFYIEQSKVYKKVTWLKEMHLQKFPHLYKYLHLNVQIKQIKKEDQGEIERVMYSIFQKENKVHFIFQVEQADDILCQSLYGLVDLILDGQPKEQLKIKISLQSPGIIEFITDHLDVITTILKVIQLIHLLTKKKTYTLDEKSFMKEHEELIKKFYDYQVNKLNLELPKIKNQ